MAYWLSEPVESLLDAIACDRMESHCDVLVVGSGYGGAIAAMRLAGEGRRVRLFERGKEYALGDFPENLSELPGHVRFMRPSDERPLGYADALFDLRIADKVAALVGNGLGGGSLINANVALPPDPETLRDPVWPQALREKPGELTEAMRCASQLLGVTCDPHEPGKLKALRRLSSALGAECRVAPITVCFDGGANAVGVQQAPCVRCGNCVTGCNIGAKNTLAMNALPLAKARGARLYTGASVLSLEPLGAADGSGGWSVRFRRTATEKTTLRSEIHAVTADVVVLAAGTLGSTEILLRSQARRKIRCSPHLGKSFSTNGDSIAFGYAQREPVGAVATTGSLDPDPKSVGPTINGFATMDLPGGEHAPRRKLLLEDGAIPVSLARVFAELAVSGSLIKRYVKDSDPAWCEANPDRDPLGVHREAIQHSQLLLCMGDDGAAGELRLRGSSAEVDPQTADDARLEILWPEGAGSRASLFLGAVDKALRDAESNGFDGGDYIQNPAWRPVPANFGAALTGDPPEGPLLAVHPLGGCPMGDDARNGAVDHHGRVFRATGDVYAGLYVMDGAVIPRALGVNPFLTIAGLAWRSSGALLEKLKWPESRVDRAALADPPVSRCLLPTQPEKVSMTIVEKLLGNLGDSRPQWLRPPADPGGDREPAVRDWLAARITIDIPDVDAWLENPGIELNACCELFINAKETDEFDQGQLTCIVKCQGTVRLLAPDGPDSHSQARRRAIAAVSAYLQRSRVKLNRKRGAEELLEGMQRVALNHAHWRVLDYRFVVRPPGEHRRWLITARKELAYHPGKPNVWTALVELPLELAPEGAARLERYRGTLRVDLVDLSRRALAQVRNQVHTPPALMAMIGTGMLFLRVLFQTHFWSFAAPDYQATRPAGNRDPHAIASPDGKTVEPERVPFLVPAGGDGEPPLELRLWRYRHPTAARGDKVLLIHGLAHGANVFATRTIRRPLAECLHEEGFEVWLLDYRLSPALEKASRRQSTMDEIARYDIAQAVRIVYKEAGEPIRVFAHCIGAGCFSMSVLGGHCQDAGRSMIRMAAIHAVPPWVEPSKANRLRANLAALLQDVIGDSLADPIPPEAAKATFRETMIDRFAGSLPWSQAELREHAHHRDHAGMGQTICNRMTLLYGVEWVHRNLSEATHRDLAELVGVGNIETFRQIFFIAQRKRITDREGHNIYLTGVNIRTYWTFPTLFAHGAENQVFSSKSSRRSAAGLALAQNGSVDVFLEEIPGYGHMDFLFGERAHLDVHPKIRDFFAGRGGLRKVTPDSISESERPDEEPADPVVGPVIGRAYRNGGTLMLSVWLEAHDDVTYLPRSVIFRARLRNGQWQEESEIEPAIRSSVYGRYWYMLPELPVPADALEIELRVNYADPLSDSRRSARNSGLTECSDPAGCVDPVQPSASGARGLDLDAPWFRRIAGLEQRDGCSFLAGSCRHPGSPFEREVSDAVFGAMLAEVKRGADHVLFVGDQIYADATADMFDTSEPSERYAGRYRTAYSSPSMRRLLRSVPVYMAVDDHEFSDNWDGLPPRVADQADLGGPRDRRKPLDAAQLYDIARGAAMDYQRAITLSADNGDRLWYQFSSGGLPFFVMDTRSERRLRTYASGPRSAAMVRGEQLEALDRWLDDNRGEQPKFVVCGSPIGPVRRDFVGNPPLWRNADGWFGYPGSLAHLARIVAGRQPRNLVFISGDYHFSASADLAFYCDGQACVAAKQIIASGLFSPMPFANERPEDYLWDEWCAVPIAGSSTRIGVRASVLARDCSHFLRVTAAPQGALWKMSVTPIGAGGGKLALPRDL